MEHALQMELRVAFRLPWNVSTPVELVRHGCVPFLLSMFRKGEWLTNLIEITSS